METVDENILRKLIKSLILPKYPQIVGIYNMTTVKQAKSERTYFMVSLIIRRAENLDVVEKDIREIFKMSGLEYPDKTTNAYKKDLKNVIIVDFTY